jgi:hypothetical protein
MSRLRHTAVLLGALGALAVPAAALASANSVIADCADDGKLDRSYSKKELHKALDKLPSDLAEYGDCPEVIRSALESAGGGGGSGGGGAGGPAGGGAPGGGGPGAAAGPTAQDHGALERATSGAKAPSVKVGGERVKPGSNGLFDLASASNDIPLPLALALIAVVLVALGGAFWALQRRFPALAGFSLRQRLPSLRRVPLPRLRR